MAITCHNIAVNPGVINQWKSMFGNQSINRYQSIMISRPIDDQSIVTSEFFLIASIAIDYYRFSSISIDYIDFSQRTDRDDDHP